jgi:hypothetical protein
MLPRTVRAKRSVKTSTGDISVADDAMGDWDSKERIWTEKRWHCEEHARQRLEVIASTEVPKEDISALRDVEGDAPVGHYVMGGLLGQQKVSYGWVAGTATSSSANSCEQ